MSVYAEFRYYDVIHDKRMSRLSMCDERGGEFFIEIEGEGKAYRREKEQALSDIQEAIERGLFPGRVVRE